MNNYDFAALNDKEFEAFVADLLSEEYGVLVERFKPGKDAGVDGRWFASDGGEVVLQCKHWHRSGYKALLKSLKQNERPKLDLLKPKRYILATSVPLSRKNKDEIALAFAPYLSAADVLGPDDLNLLLARHPKVEERNYKLWLSSSNTFSLLLNNAIIGRSRSELALFQEGTALYVTTEDYERAWRHLNERRVLILTGEPGIGKTTLARQLVLEYVAQGFGLAVIEESVSEAEAVFDENAKQVFYFDDFLGRTFLEALKAKQDSHVTNFARRIGKDPSKRFILTSRTNILNQGAVLSDLFGKGQLMKNTYELRIGNLSRIDRAKILYNHLWHSNLDPAYVDELYRERRYRKVIDHPNFNPRLIAFILDRDKVTDIEHHEYWKYIERTLENPEDVWAHFFSAQLSQDCRDLVFITVLNGKSIREEILRTSFCSLPPRNEAHAGAVHHAFDIAIRHASGSVLDREIEVVSHDVSYELFNPSIADYVLRFFSGTNLWEYYYPHIRTHAALVQLEQLRRVSFFGESKYNQVLRSLALAEIQRKTPRDNYSLELAGLLASNKPMGMEFRSLLRPWILQPELTVVASRPAAFIRILLGWRVIFSKDEMVEQTEVILSALNSMYLPLDEPRLLKALLAELKVLGLDEVYDDLREQILTEWGEQAPDVVRSDNVLGDYHDHEDAWSAAEELERFMNEKLSETGIELTSEELKELCDNVSIDDIINDNIEVASREDWQAESWRDQWNMQRDDIAAVDDLFERDGS